MKYTQVKLDPVLHAYLKAEAQINNMTLPEYMAQLVKQDLIKKGYIIDRKPNRLAAVE